LNPAWLRGCYMTTEDVPKTKCLLRIFLLCCNFAKYIIEKGFDMWYNITKGGAEYEIQKSNYSGI